MTHIPPAEWCQIYRSFNIHGYRSRLLPNGADVLEITRAEAGRWDVWQGHGSTWVRLNDRDLSYPAARSLATNTWRAMWSVRAA